MKKELAVVLFVLILAFPAAAQDNEIYDRTYLLLDSEISSSIDIIRQPGSRIDYVNAELYFFPQTDKRQSVLEIETEPEAAPAEEKFIFSWQSPAEDRLEYSVKSSVKVENKFEKVYEKISFPITDDIPADVAEYKNPTEKVDSGSSEIVKLANQLAEGEDDLFIVIHNIAEWVEENIKYDLNTVTAEASQKASWVLANRQGVCDELTNLFMAMCRSLGIPARFISGISYTNDPQFAEKWGPHGWAEVYLPGYGWVPFDVTYGELGWIDPSHIKLLESIDPDRPSGKIEWRGLNFEAKGSKFNLKTSITETGGKILDTVEITAKAHKRKTGFGSYNLFEADIRNLRDYYVTTDISVSAPKEVEVAGSSTQHIILRPGETKKIFWVLKVSPSLGKEYVYTFPLIAYNQRNTSGETEFRAEYRETVYSQEEIEELVAIVGGAEEKEYSKDLSIECAAEKGEFYYYEDNSIRCVLENKGNTALENIQVCYGTDCKRIPQITIAQKEEAVFDIAEEMPGERGTSITAKNQDVSASVYVPFVVLDNPKAKIEGLNFQQQVEYSDESAVEFTISKESYSILYNAKISVGSSRIRQEWEFEEMGETKNFVFEFPASSLKAGKNDFSITAYYEDKYGKSYSEEEHFEIELANLSLVQRAATIAKGIVFFIVNLF
ncbi:transglutaminase domain-containing protein [Candidatus Woesearchaeota archaeon]|nr:transglutaminase domain-containing protein [Candidatus Woesearchaeota archaeon]